MTFHILGISSSQLTNSIIFQRGRYTTNQFSKLWHCCFAGSMKSTRRILDLFQVFQVPHFQINPSGDIWRDVERCIWHSSDDPGSHFFWGSTVHRFPSKGYLGPAFWQGPCVFLVESVGPAALLLLLALFCVSTPMPVLERIAGLVFFFDFLERNLALRCQPSKLKLKWVQLQSAFNPAKRHFWRWGWVKLFLSCLFLA